MEKKTSITLLKYLDEIEQQAKEQYNYSEQIKEVAVASGFVRKFSGVVFVADFQTGTYPFIGEGVEELLGHPFDAFMEGGMKFTDHYAQVPTYVDSKCIAEQIKFFSSIKDMKFSDIRFKMNSRIIDKNKKIRYYSQRYKIIHRASDDFPLGVYGYCTKVPAFEEDKIIQQIEFFNTTKNEWEEYSHLEFYLKIDENKLLSKREIEILKWISEGLSSEAIASKLYISVHTVRTHRKNMLKRTNSTNSADLIRYGIEHKLI
ncbi:response regulator transcription factor [Emticicia soli]|uniref:Response regulator transcription factor n=1 Tax=Emticicia soli TaxID=2027878 RepID=A0ABW5JCG3_9BACT